MNYDKTQTENHIVSKTHTCCVKDFNQIILNEDNNLAALPTTFNNVTVLDLDCVEIINAKNETRNQNRTMDCTFAISNAATIQMLLVELRFNYKNLANLNRIVLLEKVNGSFLALDNSVDINSNYIFIFQPHLVQQAINRLQRMNPKIPNNYTAMDLDQLIANYF